MKKWMLYTIETIFIVGIIGGFFINHEINASTYNSSMKNGRTEIRKSQYNAAQANFQRAAKIKPDSMEANNLLMVKTNLKIMMSMKLHLILTMY